MAYKMDEKFKPGNPMICGHRGFSSVYPENTLIAFEEAAKLGVEMVELDISMSKDGVPMLFHDDYLDQKTTPLKGHIGDYTREELRQVRIGSKLGMEDQPLATLEEFLQAFQKYPNIVLNVDLKPDENIEGLVLPVLKMLRDYGYEDRIIINSLDGNITKYLHENYDYIVVGPPEGYSKYNQIPGLDGTYATLDALCMPTWDLTVENCSYIRSIHKILLTAPVCDEAGAQRCLDCGVEIAMCDDPRPLLKLMGRM